MKGDESPDLEGLMLRYQGGDTDAFAELYGALAGPVGRYLRGFVRDPATVEDLVQDTFLQIHRSRHTYQPPRPVRPWVYAIARHTALMYLRSRRRRGGEALPLEELPEIPELPRVDGPERRQLLARAARGLPETTREILVMHHVLGLSFAEIARILGMTEGAAKVRSHRALRTLRERLERGEER